MNEPAACFGCYELAPEAYIELWNLIYIYYYMGIKMLELFE